MLCREGVLGRARRDPRRVRFGIRLIARMLESACPEPALTCQTQVNDNDNLASRGRKVG
jgi:hypothetical protein